MNNLFSYCGLVDARIRASEKDLPVPSISTIYIGKTPIFSMDCSYHENQFAP